MLQIQLVMKEAMKINHFLDHLQKEALQAFKSPNAINNKTIEDIFIVCRRRYVKPKSQAWTKHEWYKLTSNPNTRSLCISFEELKNCAGREFGDNA